MPDDGRDWLRRALGAEAPRTVSDRANSPLDWMAAAKEVAATQHLALTVDALDAVALREFPAYVAHQLRSCGTAVVEKPTAVFRGLRPNGPGRLRNGWALVGRPEASADEHGREIPAPAGMVYVLFTDESGKVFDWDWVPADPADPNLPVASSERFQRRVHPPRLTLDLTGVEPGSFRAPVASHSPVGDCVFVYLGDTPAFAERADPQLTVFRTFERNQVVGFKLKDAEQTRGWIVTIRPDDVTVEQSTSVNALLLAASVHTGVDRHLDDLLGRVREAVPTVRWRHSDSTPPPP